jgi:hypothetical protein
VKKFLLRVELDNQDVITFDIPAGLDERKAVLELLERLGQGRCRTTFKFHKMV